MAGARFDLFTVILSLHLLVVVVLSQQDDLNSTDTSHVSIPTTTMILPLYLSPPKNTSSSHIAYRRHLLSPSARMSLHDDLLLNGYYTTRLLIGTPPQKFALIVDTGSTVTYVPCATCEQCGRHQDPRFQPKMSSTYEAMKCNIDCTCDSDRENCIYERQYAEMSSSSGVLGEDIVSFGNLSELTPQRAVFGCENMETGDLYSQHADGIMGLGRGDLSIVDQLVDKKVINDSFSLCYGGMDIGGGTMVLGKISPPADMVYSQSDPVRSPYYNIELKELHVAGKALPLDSRVFDGKHGSVLDSGTTYAYLPEPAFKAFKDAMMKELNSLKQIKGPDPNYNDLCFSGAGSEASELSKTFPSVDMVFGNGQKLTLSPENYLFRHSKERGAYCFGIFQNGKDPTTLLGGIVVRNTLVTYDREHEKIGFWKTNCSELWERLQGASSTTQNGIPPSLAPNGSPELDTSGETNIGLVTFNMLLNTTYSDLEPRIPELTESIANELDVNTSQVHLMNYTSKGNDTLLTWSIFPQGSADYMSNSTATEIISRISENRVHLPEIFGSYKFSEWKTEPSSKRTWWEENSMIVIVAFLIILILGLSMSGAWYMWRRNKEQSVVSYKPVDSIVPEQELQPL